MGNRQTSGSTLRTDSLLFRRARLSRSGLSMGRWLLLVCGLLLGSGRISLADSPSLTGQYFSGLRARGLYTLAEEYAQTLMTEAGADPEARSVLTVELSRTLQAHGSAANGAAREELWRVAEQVLTDFLDAEGDSLAAAPRQRIAIQRALLPLEQGTALAWESGLFPEDPNVRNLALQRLKQGGDDVAALRQRLLAEGSLPLVRRVTRDLLIHQVEALVLSAELLGAGDERTATLENVRNLLIAELREHPEDNAGIRPRLIWAVAERLQGNPQKAESVLDGISLRSLSREEQDRILAERCRAALAAGDLDRSFKLMESRIREGNPSDELRCLGVEILLRQWAAAGERHDAEQQTILLREARNQWLQTRGKWYQLAESRMHQVEEDQELGADLAACLRRGRGAWMAGRTDEAVDEYGQAAMLAHRSGMKDRAADYALTRASILISAQRWEQAAAALGEVVKTFPQHPQVADADLLRCFATGRLAARQASPQRHQEFRQGLEDHIARYPDSLTSGEALWMLAADARQGESPADAVTALSRIPASHPRAEAGDLELLSVLSDVVSALPAGDPDVRREEWRRRAVAEARRIGIRHLEKTTPFTLPRGQVLLGSARMLLEYAPQPDVDEDRFLSAVAAGVEEESRRRLKEREPLPDDWEKLSAAAARMRIVSLTAQGRVDEAREMLLRLDHEDPGKLLEVLTGLTDLMPFIPDSQRRDLGRLQRLAVQGINRRRHELSSGQQRRLEECAAQAHRASGDLLEAAARYEELLAATPNDKRLITELISIRSELNMTADLHKARDLWRRLESLSPAGSPDWLAARLEIVSLSMQQGEIAEAKKLLGVARTLYPQMGTPPLKARSDELWKTLTEQSP